MKAPALLLKSLRVKNFALFEDETVEFVPGFNALTGETGAGKSLLLEALGFLLGSRGGASLVRDKSLPLTVEGVFEGRLPAEAAFALKSRLPAPAKGKGASLFVLAREIDASGRTRARLGDAPLPLSELKAAGEALADFHSQHEHQALLRPAAQLEILDGYAGLDEERERYRGIYARYKALQEKAGGLKISEEERAFRLERARFELAEIEEAGPRAGEEEEIESELPFLKNADKMRGFLEEAHGLLDSGEPSLSSGIAAALKSVSRLAEIDAAFQEPRDRLLEAQAGILDASQSLEGWKSKIEFEPGRLDFLYGRLEKIGRLKQKYGPSLQDVLDRAARLKDEAESLENRSLFLAEAEEERAKTLAELKEAAGALHDARAKAARRLESAVADELKSLGMPRARFEVEVLTEEESDEGAAPGPAGADAVEFHFCANPGEPLRPLRLTASGGELSRAMLSIKSVLAEVYPVSILVFDEIDSGVGGAVGRAVAEKLSALSRGRQVLCVTHLPQIAAAASAQLGVSKGVANGRAKVLVRRLGREERIRALSEMLGSPEPTPASLRHASELLAAGAGARA